MIFTLKFVTNYHSECRHSNSKFAERNDNLTYARKRPMALSGYYMQILHNGYVSTTVDGYAHISVAHISVYHMDCFCAFSILSLLSPSKKLMSALSNIFQFIQVVKGKNARLFIIVVYFEENVCVCKGMVFVASIPYSPMCSMICIRSYWTVPHWSNSREW